MSDGTCMECGLPVEVCNELALRLRRVRDLERAGEMALAGNVGPLQNIITKPYQQTDFKPPAPAGPLIYGGDERLYLKRWSLRYAGTEREDLT